MKSFIRLSLSILFAFWLISCNTGNKKTASDSAAYTEYISAYTSGVISITDDIRINLNSIADEVINDQLPAELIKLDPSVAGKITLSDGHMLIFHPEKPFPSGQS
ncbi:MAG: hypothetical protein GZ094_24735, partial [Mariniphaga sp.]|nr:hypothetical protein [Mariniphaga sp.]